ncbi:MAG: HK97 family phage prohead protease [bacterium]
MDKKEFKAQFKAFEGEGRGLAIFATMNVIDRDKDVTIPGAFGEQTVKLAQAHQWQLPNVGMAKIREQGNDALASFQFYLDMAAGREWFSALKNNFDNGVPQEWSYGFNIEDSGAGEFDGQSVRFLKKLKMHEISPVMVGAGIDTRTLDIKEEKQFEIQTIIFPKSKWDAVEPCKKWLADHEYRNDKVDETEESYRFRQVDPGEFTRLRTICLDPSRDTPMDDCRIKAVGGPRKEFSERSMKLEDHFIFVESSLAEAQALIHRTEELKDLRAKEGRELSRANRERLGRLTTRLRELEGELSAARVDIDTLLHETDPQNIQALAQQFANSHQAREAYERYQTLCARFRGHLN